MQPELRARINQFAQRIGAQGIGLEQWLQATGKEPAEFGAEMRVTATDAVRVDLALRAVGQGGHAPARW